MRPVRRSGNYNSPWPCCCTKRAARITSAQGREKAQQLTSFCAPVSVVKREFSLPERIRLVEHLWHVAFTNGDLDLHEDHYVRKIAHLLHVPNTQSMLARNRARQSESDTPRQP